MAEPGYETMHFSWYWDLTGHPITQAADQLNQFSRDGWELVGIATTPNVGWEWVRGGMNVEQPGSRTVGIWHLASFQRPIAG